MTYQFYADKQDKFNILDYIFNETDLKAYDLSSSPDAEISVYKTAQEIIKKFDLESGKQFAITFNLWSPTFKGEIIFQKRELNPKRCNGHTFKFTTEGWGLIQLYFGVEQAINFLNQASDTIVKKELLDINPLFSAFRVQTSGIGKQLSRHRAN
jgi:hypothetical protein